VRLYGRSEKDEAFKRQTTIFLSLKLTPDDAHVSPLFFSPSSPNSRVGLCQLDALFTEPLAPSLARPAAPLSLSIPS
jgi:hypothetical protein